MVDLLTLTLAMVILFGTTVSTLSFAVRGKEQAQRYNANPMSFVVFYSLIGFLVGGVIVTVIFILAQGMVKANLREKVCYYFVGGNVQYCSKYQNSSS